MILKARLVQGRQRYLADRRRKANRHCRKWRDFLETFFTDLCNDRWGKWLASPWRRLINLMIDILIERNFAYDAVCYNRCHKEEIC